MGRPVQGLTAGGSKLMYGFRALTSGSLYSTLSIQTTGTGLAVNLVRGFMNQVFAFTVHGSRSRFTGRSRFTVRARGSTSSSA